jgi:glycosyltransferase involved in cell wall biosynthesis
MSKIYIKSDTKFLILNKKENFNVEICINDYFSESEISLVLDIYSFNPILKNYINHYTWQKFQFDQHEVDLGSSKKLSVEIEKKKNFNIKVEKKDFISSWFDKKVDVTKDNFFLLQILIRTESKANRVLFNLKIPVFKNIEQKEKFYNIESSFNNFFSKNLIKTELKKRKIYFIQKQVYRYNAVGNFFLYSYNLFKNHNYDVEIFSEDYDLNYNQIIKHRSLFPNKLSDNDIILFFYYSHDDFIDKIKDYPNCKKILFFQNITPEYLLKIFNPEEAQDSVLANKSLDRNILYFDQIIGNSQFTCQELKNRLVNSFQFVRSLQKKIINFDKYYSIFFRELNKIEEGLGDKLVSKIFNSINNFKLNEIMKISGSLEKDSQKIYNDYLEINTDDKNLDIKLRKIISCPPLAGNIKLNRLRTNKITKQINFITVSRLAPNKKIEDTIQFFSEYLNFNSNANLTIIGTSGEFFYKDFLLDKVKKLKIEDNVNFIDVVSDEELKNYYSKSDVYITMSEFEGFGLPVLEAALNGCFIFAYKLEVYSEILKNSGYFFNSKNFNELAKNLYEILKNDQIRTEIINNQYKDLEELNLNEKNLLNTFVEYIG